jgi:uncharacterized protein (DUF1330 family)
MLVRFRSAAVEEQRMPYAYVISQVSVTDPAALEEYRAGVLPVMQKFGGEFLVRGGRFERLEGAEAMPRQVLMRFPSYQHAVDWYHSPEYARLKEIRIKGAHGNIYLVEGV